MIHDKLDSMNDPMLIILSLDVAESPINQAFSIHGTEEEKLNIHSCHIKPTSPYLCLSSSHVDQSVNLDCLTRHWPTCEDYPLPLPLSFVLSVSWEGDQWWWYNELEFWVGIELSFIYLGKYFRGLSCRLDSFD